MAFRVIVPKPVLPKEQRNRCCGRKEGMLFPHLALASGSGADEDGQVAVTAVTHSEICPVSSLGDTSPPQGWRAHLLYVWR